FPHGTNLPMGLAVDWEGESHLIHLDGPHRYHEAGIELGHSLRGVVLSVFEVRVDLTSRYDTSRTVDPMGALVIRDGRLFMFCRQLGDRFRMEPHAVPIDAGYLTGTTEEACGFTRWSIAVRDGHQTTVLRRFEALPLD
ncbi:MAG TPA: hypothetical protein VFO12_09690, partial [Sphingomicrobium sp.]|nr:hypothetical protein [Sphingomicrobium sp.]